MLISFEDMLFTGKHMQTKQNNSLIDRDNLRVYMLDVSTPYTCTDGLID